MCHLPAFERLRRVALGRERTARDPVDRRSLDGTLARVRGIERPRCGYYLDHLVDAIATAAIGIRLGLSPFMLLSVGTLIVVPYLALSINVYLESQAFGRFSIGYGKIGPTEIRLVSIALNTDLRWDDRDARRRGVQDSASLQRQSPRRPVGADNRRNPNLRKRAFRTP